MPLTVAQTTAFFEHDVQMGIPHDTVLQLQEEGITLVDDLIDFEKDTIEQVAANLRRPAGRVPDPNPNAAPGATIPTPSFFFGAKSQKRLVTATQLLRYYDEVRGEFFGKSSARFLHEFTRCTHADHGTLCRI
jgi:hypothetical protein